MGIREKREEQARYVRMVVNRVPHLGTGITSEEVTKSLYGVCHSGEGITGVSKNQQDVINALFEAKKLGLVRTQDGKWWTI